VNFFRRTAVVAVFLVGASLMSPWANSGEKGKGKGKEFEDKSSKQAPAASVSFTKALDLAYDSLSTLGSRIDQARKAPDPVGLASCARELAIAEQVSKKAASLTSAALMKEAAELAKQRFDATELKAVALMVGNETVAKELNTAAARAEKEEAKRIADAQAGSKSRGIQGQLHVDSRVGTTINVYVDGRYVGTMGPFGDIYPYIGQTPWETTYLSARSVDGRTWNRAVSSAVGDYTWTLYP
jgi:hypothetical protein